MPPKLRIYQQNAIDNVRNAYRSGRTRPLLVLPTGGGKTVCFSHITAGAASKGKRVMILVHRQELLKQCSAALTDLGVPHGAISAQRTPDPTQAVQIASVQTLVRRFDRVQVPDLIIADEAHHAVAGSWAKVIAQYPQARVLGVTATPCRLDGGNLGDVFDELIIGPQVSELMAAGFLCPVSYYAPSTVDLAGVHTVAGDYNRRELNERVDRPTITGDAITHDRKLAHGLPCVVFCASVAHAENVCAQYVQAGYRARVLEGTMTDADRADAVASLADGRITHLVTVDIVSEGFDLPVVTVCQMLRATQSLGLYLQQLGRVLRTHPGKQRAIVLDHVGNVLRHGFAEDVREWTLTGSMRSNRKAKDTGPKYRQCPTCYAVHPPAPVCPQCGTAHAIDDRTPEQVAGELEELKADMVRREARREQGRAQSIDDLIAIGRARGMKNPYGWAKHVFRARSAR
jgi:DNA repair protein RadD